jgi:ABC-type iron transport system FetAB ATPase subunit
MSHRPKPTQEQQATRDRHREVVGRLDTIIRLLTRREDAVMAGLADVQAALDALNTKVTNVEGAEASAIELIRGLAQMLKDIIAQGGDTAAIVAAINATADKLQADADALGAAVAENPLPA